MYRSFALIMLFCLGTTAARAGDVLHCQFSEKCNPAGACKAVQATAQAHLATQQFFFMGKPMPVSLMDSSTQDVIVIARDQGLEWVLGFTPDDPLFGLNTVLSVGAPSAPDETLDAYFGVCQWAQ